MTSLATPKISAELVISTELNAASAARLAAYFTCLLVSVDDVDVVDEVDDAVDEVDDDVDADVDEVDDTGVEKASLTIALA